MELTVKLYAIREHDPDTEVWEKLLKHLGKTKADATEVSFRTILESNGLEDTLWCLRALPRDMDCAVRELNCDMAETALKFVPEGEDRPRVAIETSRRFARGDATQEELAAARYTARYTAWAAARYTASDAQEETFLAWLDRVESEGE